MARYINPIPNLESDKETKSKIDREAVGDYKDQEIKYFVFIDALGFKQAFFDNGKSEKSSKELSEKYSDVFYYYFELMNDANFMMTNECYAGQTSDSLYFYTSRADWLVDFIILFSHFNMYAMEKNIFFRGGIAKGGLSYKENYQFYGDSVIKAYLLESEIAKNPIISVDQSTFEDIIKIGDYKWLIRTEHERHYIKPFVILEEERHLPVRNKELIREVKKELIIENIKSNKRNFEYDNGNFGKFVFLEKEFAISDE
ncbi:MAG: hypothetical protein FWC91_12950 [Defluviitaleaceae bacterium]|nr:hypothetical protein [Defluviitaleaceae bacterium]